MNSTNCFSSIINNLQSCWRDLRLPLFTMFTIIICLILGILIHIKSELAYFLIIDSYSLLSKYNFWCIFTFPYQHYNIIHYIFAIISFTIVAYKKENNMGTARYFIFFTLNNLTLGAIFICLGLIMHFVKNKIYSFLIFSSCGGLWPFIMVEIVIKCNIQPDRYRTFWCSSFIIRDQYYPWLIFAIFFILTGSFWDLLVGIFIGYLRK